jgi:hypothetical protein
MTNEERKRELQARRRLASYPRRREAQFSEANAHNPLILQDCPACCGTGKRDHHTKLPGGGSMWELGICADCGGAGTTGEVEPYFLTEMPEATAMSDADGWLRCPGCGIVFTTRDPRRWTGYRHMSCGQRIRISKNDA